MHKNDEPIKNWRKVSQLLNESCEGEPTRTAVQCRERWFNHVDTSLDKSKFTAEEDLLLLRTTLKIGFGRWNEIAENLNQQTGKTFKRNEIQVKNRMRCLLVNVRDLKIGDRKESVETLIEIVIN